MLILVSAFIPHLVSRSHETDDGSLVGVLRLAVDDSEVVFVMDLLLV